MELLRKHGVSSDLPRAEFVYTIRRKGAEFLEDVKSELFISAKNCDLARSNGILVRRKDSAMNPLAKKLAEDVWTLADCLNNRKEVPRTLLKNGKRAFREFQASQQVTRLAPDEQVTLTSGAIRERAQEAYSNSNTTSLQQPARSHQGADQRHESRVNAGLQDTLAIQPSNSQLVIHQLCDNPSQLRDTSMNTLSQQSPQGQQAAQQVHEDGPQLHDTTMTASSQQLPWSKQVTCQIRGYNSQLHDSMNTLSLQSSQCRDVA